ncbi:hypothetical protein WMF04_15500 [Sorangium sp. So ce260]|uniref:hypothetical protein n=1 Tax=Sorangium sp. So ce260 TaxID=3133291 RepID=UPI003F621CDF
MTSTTPGQSRGSYKIGGAALIASGLLFLVRDFLDLIAGPPPASGAEILAWAASRAPLLAIANEALFFAGMLMVPAVIALYSSFADTDKFTAGAACGLMAVVAPVIAVLCIVHGRLVYPVYGIRIGTPDVAALVIAVFYGGLHATGILMGAATLVLSLLMRRGIYARWVAYLGIATSVADVVGAYPYIIGPVPTLFCHVLFTAWFVAVGWVLYKMR